MAEFHLRKRPARAVAAPPLPWWSDQIVERIQSEYHEMPGMMLTVLQARRLFGLCETDPEACEALLDYMVARGVLRRTATGAYGLRAER